MSQYSRRRFIKTSLAGAAGLAGSFGVLKGVGAAGAIGANEAINIGVIGIRGRGKSHIDAFLKIKNVRVSHLIDVDKGTWGPRVATVDKHQKSKPICFQDARKAFEDKNLNAVSIATCNHTHSLLTIWGCQAGKDVYVEKPASHNVWEGRVAVEVARKHKRIVQHGSQSRGSRDWANIAAIARSGKLGKLLISHGIASKPRNGIGFKQPKTPPKELDFNLWLGPAPMQPYHENIVPYNWHWFWDFGNGEIGNQGVHQMDIARWAIPGATLPTDVLSLGGRFCWGDQGQTPNTQLTVSNFGDSLLIFENCNLTDDKTRRVDNDFYFEAGRVVGSKRFYPKGSDKTAPLPKVDVPLGPGNIFENFIHCIRTRDRSVQHADILEAHYSSALCHVGNVSYRLGTETTIAKTQNPFGGDTFGDKAWDRLSKFLQDTRKVKLDATACRIGRKLKFDPKTEKFVNDPQADRLLTREYRKPFEPKLA